MKRIGLAANKRAKGNLLIYNLYVILISFLFSAFIFILAGATVIFALTIISYLASELLPVGVERSWNSILSTCMVALTVIIFIFTLLAISQNIKLKK